MVGLQYRTYYWYRYLFDTFINRTGGWQRGSCVDAMGIGSFTGHGWTLRLAGIRLHDSSEWW